MKKKVLIEFKSNTIEFFIMQKQEKIDNSLLDTNIISNNQLLFSIEYLRTNEKIVKIFIKELCEDKNISNVSLNDITIIDIICKLISKTNIEKMTITSEDNFTYLAYESIIQIPSIKEITCFSIPNYMIELFDTKKIKVNSTQEILFTSNFIKENKLNQYSKFFYKTMINLNSPLDSHDLEDFETFLKINKYLKVIHFNKLDSNDLKSILLVIKNLKLKNIKIIIHDNITDKNIVEELKEINKKFSKRKVIIKVSYSKKYIKDNYLKQIIITTISYCFIITLCLIFTAFTYILLNNRDEEKKVASIKENINQKMESVPKVEEKINDIPEINEENSENEEQLDEPPIEKPKQINPILNSLKDINKDTVGWLTVPKTNIDYPVVQAKDNKYYLDHNFNNEKQASGWIFMNYVNNPTDLERNTVLFGHNNFYSSLMFGTLRKINNKEWYGKANENLITFNTLYDEMKWEVFSIYSIDVTADYIKTIFNSDEEFLDFVKLIKGRSVFKSDIVLNKDSKILTLSTCQENNKRLVVHAVLKND